MRPPPLRLALLLCLAAMTAACATQGPPAPPPRLTLPEAAREACKLPVLPDEPTQGDLAATYMARGEIIAVCDGRRDLAVQAFDAQQAALQPPPRPWWRRLMGD